VAQLTPKSAITLDGTFTVVNTRTLVIRETTTNKKVACGVITNL
jgi:hypothetical protein